MGDIINPEVLWIEGRCYRVNDPSVTNIASFEEHDMMYEHNEPNIDNECSDGDDDFEITMMENNRYSTSFHVPKQYLGYIIGKRGATRSRIEHETKTNIQIPRQEQSGDIVIIGSNASSVRTARRRIQMIVVSSRTKQPYTHFLYIMVNNAEIIENFIKFKEEVLQEGHRGIDDIIFQNPSKLHLTLGLMCLMDNEERQQASKLLTEATEKLVMPLLQQHGPLKIRMKGVSYMNDDPKEVHVLFGLVQEEDSPPGLLQTIADAIVDYFDEAGFSKEKDTVKLHVTLINSRYRSKEKSDVRYAKRESFDASGVLEKYADYDFGVVEVSNIHLSALHLETPERHYLPLCVVPCSV